MPRAQRIYPRIMNDILHDLAFGVFPGVALAAWIIRGTAERLDAGVLAVQQAAPRLWAVMVLGLTISVLTGLFRLRYWRLNVRSGALELKGQMASTKHAAFVLVLVASAAALAYATGS